MGDKTMKNWIKENGTGMGVAENVKVKRRDQLEKVVSEAGNKEKTADMRKVMET